MCQTQRGALNVIAGVPTTGALVKLIGSWKYHGVRGLAWPLAELAGPVLHGDDSKCILIPVPLHRSRLRERGFNQARQLAELLAQAHGLEVRNDILIRNRSTPQQAKLDSHDTARSLNVSKSFHTRPASGDTRSLILVDDLVTSGATVLAAAQSLREAGWSVNTVCAIGVSSA
jgi:ComF family protein